VYVEAVVVLNAYQPLCNVNFANRTCCRRNPTVATCNSQCVGIGWWLTSVSCDFVSVCLCVRTLKGKWLEPSTPNLVHFSRHTCSACSRSALSTLRSKRQRSRLRDYQMHCRYYCFTNGQLLPYSVQIWPLTGGVKWPAAVKDTLCSRLNCISAHALHSVRPDCVDFRD